MASSGDTSVRTLQQLDRLVSASSPSDALESIQVLTASLHDIFKSDEEDKEEKILAFLSACYENADFMASLCSLLSDGTMRSASSSGSSMIVDDGDSAACSFLSAVLESLDLKPKDQTEKKHGRNQIKSFYQERQNHLKKMLSSPNDGAIVHALVDLLSPGHHDSNSDSGISLSKRNNLYAQTQALKIVSSLISILPTLIHSHTLSAPDGLNRILDLLHNSTTEESIRNEAILLCTSMAKTNAGCARLMIFGEAYEKVLQIAESEISHDNQVSSASVQVIVDCFNLAIELTKQDEMGSEVFLGSKSLVTILIKFLDLRTGEKFVYPEILGAPSGSHEDEVDDLDDILNNGKKVKAVDEIEQRVVKIPYLTVYESTAILAALELLRVLIVGDESILTGKSDDEDIIVLYEKKRSRQQTILSYDILSRLVIDMALYTLPPPDSPSSVYVSAVPLHEDQLKALDVFAALSLDCGDELQHTILNKEGIYLHAGVLDRLMYLVCTGDGANRPAKDADEISMYSLGVLRCLLSAKEASIMVMHTLAPPIDDQGPDAPPVFQKLVNTLAENLYCLIDPNVAKDLDNNEIDRINRMIIGSAGALGIFLTNGAGDTTREMLLRVPVPPPPKADENSSVESHRTPMIDCMLAYFEQSLQDSRVSQKSSAVLSALLRLFVEWIPSAPNVISAIFSASSSISFSALLQKKVEKGKPPIVQSLSALFLGLCLEYMNPENEIGGWTSASIVNMISNGMGIRKFTQILESLKMPLLSNDGAAVPPWTCSPAERSHFMKWYTENVNIVRKRTVQELTVVANNQDDSDNEDTDQLHKAFPLKDQKSIYKLVSEQNSEIESLRRKLADSENKQKLQSSKLKIFQKRLEANPSQLDDMLNELTTKISDLESQNRNLKNDSISLEMQHEKELKSKAEEIHLIQENIKILELEKKVILEEHISTQKELEGLSSSYTNLEEEYNNISKNGSIKEEVIAVSSYRKVEEENLKLKHDVHAANEWMRKAVLKMDELKRRNQSLESELNVSKSAYTQYVNDIGSEIDSLRSQLASQNGQMEIMSTERDSLTHQMEELKAKLTAAEIEINEKGDSVDGAVVSELNDKIISLEMKLEKQDTTFEDTLRELRSSLIAKDGRLIELEQKLEDAQELVIASEMNESRNSEILNLEDDVKKLTEANKAAQQWMANAVKHHNSLKNQLDDAKRKIDVLENEQCVETNLTKLQEELHLITTERNHALERIRQLEPLKEEIEILRNEHLVQLREWKDEKEYLEAALSEKNELISNLESKTLQSAVSSASSSTREESESFSLQLADFQRLRDENEILISERVDHLAAIDDMKIRLTEFQSWTETAQHRIDDLEAEKEFIERELMELRLKKSADENQDFDAHEDLVASSKARDTNESSESSQQCLINSNTNDLEEKDGSKASQQTDPVNDVHPILNDGMSPNDKVSELEAELSRLQIHMEEKDDQINKMHKDLEESQRARDDFHNSEMVVLRDKLQLLENKYQGILEENASLENKSSDLIREVGRIHEVEAMLVKKETEVSELCLEVEDARNSISKLKDEYENNSKHSQDKIKDLELEVCNLHATIQNQEDETVTAISQWETRCQELEEEIETLQTENNSNQDALAAISEWESRCSELEDEINRLISEQNSSRQEELEQEIEELKSTITLLQDEANGAISKWEERSTEMEEEIQRLTLKCSEVESLRQQLTSANEVLVSDKALIKELMINVDVERENVSTVQKEKDDAEIIYKSHIEDLERAIASHEQESLFLQSQIDDRDDLVERVNQQVLDLTKEVDDIRTQSEEVVREWQGKIYHNKYCFVLIMTSF
jgi:chromosome segregation ATPase